MITGQLFFRDAGMLAPDGRRLVMVVGTLAIDDDDEMLAERQCDVVGETTDDHLDVAVFMPGVDMSENKETMFAKLGELLLKPIWRV